MKTSTELINEIKINPANLEHIANTGKINGTLYAQLIVKFEEYASQFGKTPGTPTKEEIVQVLHSCAKRELTENGIEEHRFFNHEAIEILKLIKSKQL